MIKKRRRHTATCKFRLALEALEGSKSIGRLSSEHGIHANLIRAWKRQLLEGRAQRLRQQRRAQATGAGGPGGRTL